MFARHQSAPVVNEQITAFKLAATRMLTPHASGVLLDKQFVLDQAIEQSAVAAECGLIAAADRFVPGTGEVVGDTEIDADVDPVTYRDRGAVAMKLLVIYRPDGQPRRRIAMVKRFVTRCRAANLVSIIEPVSRKPLDGRGWDWNEGVFAAARELGSLGADLYKTEVPQRGAGKPDELRRACARLGERIDSPWVVLSSGVPHHVFPFAVEQACRAGASGFLAGRAVWELVVGSSNIKRDLGEIAAPRLQQLGEIVDAEVWRPTVAGQS